MKLGVMKVHHKAVVPEFKTDGAACFDLVAVSKQQDGNTCTYGIGLVLDIPEGYHVKIYSRSGHGFKHGISLVNAVGIIDSDYTGEISVKLTRNPIFNGEWPWIGDRIAQGMLVKNVKTEIVEVTEIKSTDRGENGFGSTGR